MMTCFIISLFCSTYSLASDPEQTIKLKDGSQIKGQVTGVANGVYTVKTPIIGDVHVNANDVAAISNNNTTAAPSPASQASPNSTLDRQVASQQQQIMANPQAMADIQKLAQDPDIMRALSDPALMQAIATHDYQAIQNNPKMQELVNNPKMQALLIKLAPAQQQQNAASQ